MKMVYEIKEGGIYRPATFDEIMDALNPRNTFQERVYASCLRCMYPGQEDTIGGLVVYCSAVY